MKICIFLKPKNCRKIDQLKMSVSDTFWFETCKKHKKLKIKFKFKVQEITRKLCFYIFERNNFYDLKAEPLKLRIFQPLVNHQKSEFTSKWMEVVAPQLKDMNMIVWFKDLKRDLLLHGK